MEAWRPPRLDGRDARPPCRNRNRKRHHLTEFVSFHWTSLLRLTLLQTLNVLPAKADMRLNPK
jgi:hypothetical protein